MRKETAQTPDLRNRIPEGARIPAEVGAFVDANTAYREGRLSRDEYMVAKRAFQEWEEREGCFCLDYQRTHFPKSAKAGA